MRKQRVGAIRRPPAPGESLTYRATPRQLDFLSVSQEFGADACCWRMQRPSTMPEATRDVTFPSIAFYGRGVVYEP